MNAESVVLPYEPHAVAILNSLRTHIEKAERGTGPLLGPADTGHHAGFLANDSLAKHIELARSVTRVALPRFLGYPLAHTFEELSSKLSKITVTLERLESGHPNERVGVLTTLQNSLAGAAPPLMTLALWFLGGADIDPVRARVQTAQSLIEDQRRKAESIVGELETLKAKAIALVEDTEVAKFAASFQASADGHGDARCGWLATVVVVTVVSMGGAYWLATTPFANGASAAGIAHDLATRAFLVSLVYMTLSFCIRNYRAHAHLEVVNAHKAACLRSFDVLLEAERGSNSTSKLLEEATRTMYATPETGQGASSSDDAVSKAIEILKGVSGATRP